MEVFVRAITLVSRLCGVAAALLIAAAVVVVCHMVFVRAVLNDNTIWQTDFTTYSLIAATFIGSPYLLLNRGHVNVDVLPLYLGRRGRFGLALAATLMSLGFCVTMTILACQFWHEAWANARVSDTMWRVRLWIPYAAMPVGLGVLTLQYVASLYNLVTGREPPFGLDPKAGPHAAPNAAPNAAPERAPGEAA